MPVDKAALLAAKAEMLKAQAFYAQKAAAKAAYAAQKKAMFMASHGAGPKAVAYAKTLGPAAKTTAAILKPVIVAGKVALGVGGSILAGILFNGF